MIVIAPLSIANTELDETTKISGLAGSFLASRVALDDRDDEAAVKFLERAISFDEESPELRRDYFSALIANGKIEEAVEIIKETQELGARKNLAAYALYAHEMRGRSWKKASSELADVSGVDLDKIMREILLAWSDTLAGNQEEALVRITDLEGPDWVFALREYHSGLIAASAGLDDRAAAHLQAIIDKRNIAPVLTETYVRAIEALVRNRSKVGDLEKAKETLAYGVRLLPNHPPFAQLQEKLAVEEPLKDLIGTAQEGAAEMFFNVASAIKRDNDGEVSKLYFQIANHLSPETDYIQLGLAELYLRQGFFETSNLHYSLISEQSSFHQIAQLEMASNLARLERQDEAIVTLEKLIESHPEKLSGYMTLGNLFSREKKYKEAAKVYGRGVRVIGKPEPHHWNLFYRQGIAFERLKDWDQAEPSFKKSLELSPNQPDVLNYLGYSWIDQGINLEEGLKLIEKAVELSPRSGFIVDSLGWAHYRLGNYEEAVKELERAVKLMPQDPTINDHLGDAYWKVGRKLEATFQWKIALASKTPHDHPEQIEAKLKSGLIDPEKEQNVTPK